MLARAKAYDCITRTRIWIKVPEAEKYIHDYWIPILQENWSVVLANLDFICKWSES